MKKRPVILYAILLGICGLACFIWLFCNPTPKPPPKPPKKHEPIKMVHVAPPKPVKPPREVQAGTLAYLDYKNGFRDVTFGSSSASLSNLVASSEDPARHLKIYTRSNEDLLLGNVPLEKIEYAFFEDRLCQITVRWKIEYPGNDFSVPPVTDLSSLCASLYGPPTKRSLNKSGDLYVWRGKKTKLTITETRLPGVDKNVNGAWTIPPTTAGEMVLFNLPSARTVEAVIASQTGQQPDGL